MLSEEGNRDAAAGVRHCLLAHALERDEKGLFVEGVGRRRGVEAADGSGAGAGADQTPDVEVLGDRVRRRASEGDDDVRAVAEVDVGPSGAPPPRSDAAPREIAAPRSRRRPGPGARRSRRASSQRPVLRRCVQLATGPVSGGRELSAAAARRKFSRPAGGWVQECKLGAFCPRWPRAVNVR